MWDKGLWIKEYQTKTCPYCGVQFETSTPIKKYCCNEHLLLDRKNRVSDSLEKYIKYMLLHNRRNTLSLEDVLELYTAQEGKCALSGVEMTYISGKGRVGTNIGIDRIEHQGPYIKENVRLVCNYVNTMRLDKTDEEFFWWCKRILNTNNINC